MKKRCASEIMHGGGTIEWQAPSANFLPPADIGLGSQFDWFLSAKGESTYVFKAMTPKLCATKMISGVPFRAMNHVTTRRVKTNHPLYAAEHPQQRGINTISFRRATCNYAERLTRMVYRTSSGYAAKAIGVISDGKFNLVKPGRSLTPES